MAAPELTDEIVNALVESARAIDESNNTLNSINEDKEKETVKEDNLIQKPTVSPTLTSNEKTRYQNIGKELFKPFISSLKQMLDQERRSAAISAGDPVKTIDDNVKVQYSEKKPTKPKEKDMGEIIQNLIAAAAMIGIVIYAFKDKIAEFFSNLWNNVGNIFSSVWNFFNPFNKESPVYKIITAYINFWMNMWSRSMGIY